MDSSKKTSIVEILKKPPIFIGGILVLILLIFSLFSGGGGSDPVANELKGLSNRHAALLEVIDGYSGDVRDGSFKSRLSQVSIILTANQNDIDTIYTESFKGLKDVKASFKAKPNEDLIIALDEASILNNLDSALKNATLNGLSETSSAMEDFRASNSDSKKFRELSDRVILNLRNMTELLSEV